ncbi:MAG: S8 family serine peptidase, partial [candidate division Zixibacteria bacterium]|nr:S8 family serine peptidase [candidate division Zixibacteria bacterium]
MTQSHKAFYHQGRIIAALFILSLASAPTMISAQTKTMKIFVKDISGGLANSQAAPSAPLLDSTFVLNPLFTFLDTVGVDSITLCFPTWDPADSLHTRPDGVIVKLSDWSDMFTLFLTDSVDYEAFRDEYITMEPLSLLSPDVPAELDYTPIDLFFANQPYMFPSGTSENRINATRAWDFTQGDETQVVTVIDVGFFKDHEDFVGRIQGGFSYVPGVAYFEPPGGLSHGTATAGIIGATGDANPNSGLGMAGLNWKSKLYLIKMNSFGTIGDGIARSDTLGYDPLSASVGREFAGEIEAKDFFGNPMSLQSFEAWIRDRSLITSKGNNGRNTSGAIKAPADFSTVIGVGANDEEGARKSNSNFGARIKVLASGVNVYRPTQEGGYNGSFGNTSAATPLVAGTISLIKAANPNLLADEAEEILYMTARDVLILPATPGYDIFTGYGIIDAGDAVQMASTKVVYRDGAAFQAGAGDRQIIQGNHTRTFWNNHGFNGGLAT